MGRRSTTPSDFRIQLGKRIKSERARVGMSSKALGQLVGADQATVSRWCTGASEMSVSMLVKVAAALNFDPRTVFDTEQVGTGVVVATGVAGSYPEAFAAGMAASNQFVDWGDVDEDDPAWDAGLDWDNQTGPTTLHVAGYTITTGPRTIEAVA